MRLALVPPHARSAITSSATIEATAMEEVEVEDVGMTAAPAGSGATSLGLAGPAS